MLLVNAQRYDNTWLWGIYPQNQNDTQYVFHGNAEGTFVNDSFVSEARFRGMTFSEMNSSISDPVTGELLFYTNGLCIRDTSGQIIENGDSLNYGRFWHPEDGAFGGRGPWCLLTLPVPDKDSLYKIIYNRTDDLTLGSMCYTDVLVSETNIKVLDKDVQFSNVNPEFGGVAACKHANGRDWWVIFSEADTNCFHKYLLTPDTFMFHSIQCYGRVIDIADLTKNAFAPDGSKLVRTALYGASDLFDFDRCSGELSNFFPLDTFIVNDSANTVLDGVNSAEFSFDNRFLYLNTSYFVLQYDLQASDINLSKDTIIESDYFVDTFWHNTGPYVFDLSQIGPDGNIYVGPGFAQRFFTTINNPNGMGDSCDLRLRNVVVPKWIELTIPYSPNYRLGRLPGSACDTIYSDIKPIYTQTPWLKVYPNPATDVVRFDYNWVEWDAVGDCQLVLADLQGRVVLSQTIPKYSSRQEVNIKELAAGVYTASVQSGEKRIAVCKVVKE